MTQAAVLSALGSAGTTTGFKNRIINGAMGIAQRGTSFSSPAASSYTLDRWLIQWGGAAPATVAQVTGPTGYRNAIQITGSSSNTSVYLVQRIESYNCSDLSGSSVTIQANISASTAQTTGWQLYYANAQDNFSSVTLISFGSWSVTTTANTYTATITGLPANALNGLQLNILPNNGGAFTSGTISITGVQLEVGSTATNFDVRSYGTELALCQRYYFKNGGANQYVRIGTGPANTTTAALVTVFMQTPMRAQPSSVTQTGAFGIWAGATVFSVTGITIDTTSTSPYTTVLNCVTSGLSVGTTYQLIGNNDGTAAIGLSAEL